MALCLAAAANGFVFTGATQSHMSLAIKNARGEVRAGFFGRGVDVGISAAGSSLNLQANDGVVTWVGSIMNDDPCNASGSARLYAVHYGSGQSVFYKIVDGLRTQVEWLNLDAGLAAFDINVDGTGQVD